MNEKLDSFIQPSLDALDCYTDMIMDKLFDITNETKLVKDIKNILEELNIIRYIGQQQQAVIKPVTERMLPQLSKTKDFHDNTRLRNQVTDLYNAADATYKAVSICLFFSRDIYHDINKSRRVLLKLGLRERGCKPHQITLKLPHRLPTKL
jgi:hypothetical protein